MTTQTNNLIFAQLKKVDVEKRLVYGRAAQEHPDHANEIMDYASSKPLFAKWSNMAKDATGGASIGNVRAMHGKVAAGKLTELNFNDDEQAIDVCAKIVDNNEWEKVLDGVYTGFSIGGSYAKRWADGDMTRYTADPAEISLVDRPCIPTATFFEVQKADGLVEKVDFKPAQQAAESDDDIPTIDGSVDDLKAFAKFVNDNKMTMANVVEELGKIAERKNVDPEEGKDKYGNVKFADAKNKKYPIDNPEHIRAAWNYINKEKNGAKYSAEDLATIKGAIVSAWKDKIDKDGPPSAEAGKADAATDLIKGLSTCQSLAGVVQSLSYMLASVEYESEQEGDNSPIPARLNDAVTNLGQILVDMTAEEVAELTAADKDGGTTPNPQVMAMAEQAKSLVKRASEFKKAGARHSKADLNHVQAMHDSAVALGAQCTGAEAAGKAHSHDGLEKGAGWKDEMNKAIAAATEPLQKALESANEKLAKIEAQPAPAKIVLRAVAKGDDVDPDLSKQQEIKPVIAADGKESETASLIKSVHKQGGQQLKF